MSLQGPVVSMQPVSIMSGSPTHPLNKHLMSAMSRRERSSSSSDVSSLPVAQHRLLPLPPSPLDSIQRSQSMPRGANLLPDPHLNRSLPTSKSTEFRKMIAHSRIKRAETVETYTLSKEDFEDYTQVNQYKVMDIIGHGSYGIVRKATDDTDELFALKIVGKRRLRRKSFPVRPKPGAKAKSVSTPLDNISREIAILKKLDHPNVVKLIEVLDDPQEDELILVFEYIPNGPVVSQLPTEDTLTEDKAREYFIDVLLGLEYLHSKHIIHRDIKPENLLLDDNNRVKIADFGVSEEIMTSDALLTRSAGTPAFTAPECLKVSTTTYKGQAVDIWAAGVTLYCFIYGKPPWSAKFITELHELIQTEDLPFPDNPQISPELRDLLIRLMEKDPDKRITILQIREHPWILQSDHVLPSCEENCRGEIDISEDDIKKAFKPFSTPIHILVMIKRMAKQRSFTNPYSPRVSPKHTPQPLQHVHMATQEKRRNSQDKREQFAKSHGGPVISVESYDAEQDSISGTHSTTDSP